MSEFCKSTGHLLVELVIQKCQVKFTIMTNYWLFCLGEFFDNLTKTQFKLNQFIDLFLNFSLFSLCLFLLFLILFWILNFLRYLLWLLLLFFRIFLITKSKNRVYYCNCCILPTQLRFQEACACLSIFGHHRL